MRSRSTCLAAAMALLTTAIGHTQPATRAPVLDLWSQGKAAFGVFVPDERPRGGRRGTPEGQPDRPPYSVAGGERLAANPLYDYVFLNLESGYDLAYVRAIAEGLRSAGAVSHKALLVRIPPIARDGEDQARLRVREILSAGADGVVFPHIRGVEEARQAIAFAEAAGANLWSPASPSGDNVLMLMLEDPDAVAAAADIAALPGYSILACGIGSLRGALGGDREAAEAGVQKVLAESRRAGLVNMLTANAEDVEQRLREGFLALLMQGQNADEAIRIGRRAAGR